MQFFLFHNLLKLLNFDNLKSFLTQEGFNKLKDKSLIFSIGSLAPNIIMYNIWNSKRTYKDSSILTKIWNRAVKEASFENIKLYAGTRHSFASQAVNRGVPLNLIQSFLGHTHQSTTKRYAHLDTQGLKIV
ncbi:MAG: tyrosine-type recombinase/integrase [bacterium]